MRDVEVQNLMDKADDLRESGKYKESIRYYLDALNLARDDWNDGIKDELWQKKVIFMACNGMGIAYAKLGKPEDALDNFTDVVLYAPTEKTKQIAKRNLDKYQKALEDKTGVESIFHFID